MKVTRVYTGADGESHFDALKVEVEKLKPGEGIIFRHAFPGDFHYWHRAPRRQCVMGDA